jgi:hypothetical protein
MLSIHKKVKKLDPGRQNFLTDNQQSLREKYIYAFLYKVGVGILWKFDVLPSGKYFLNATNFKSSPQNNRLSAAFLKQILYGSGTHNKYL